MSTRALDRSILPAAGLSRRRFFQISAAGAAGMTLFEAARACAEGTPGPQREYAWFPMGIQSYTLRSMKVDAAIDAIAKLGLHHVEFFGAHFPLDSSIEQIAEMKKKLRVRELIANAHGVNGFSKDHEANRRIFEFANRAGIRNLSADFGADALESLEKLVKEYGIRIAIHNHGPGHRFDKITDCLKMVEGRHPWIGFCADLGHFIRSGEDPVKVVRELGARLYGIHLKDFAEMKKDAKGVVIGKGHLDVAGVFKALREVGFPADGALSLEYEENPANPLPDVEACLAAAREAAAKAFGV